MFSIPKSFVLASSSPRRLRLLKGLDLSFQVVPADIDESIQENENAAEYVERLSNQKCKTVSELYSESLVLGADTIVVLDNEILGKPRSRDHAGEMLRSLSGRTHLVYTGFSLRHAASGRSITVNECTEVCFGEISDVEIGLYVDSGSPMDKAGSYGIQDDFGCMFIDSIKGDYYNVVGLPLRKLYTCLRDYFPDYPIFAGSLGLQLDSDQSDEK